MFEQLPYRLTRLHLRLLRRDDLAAFHAYRNDPEVARFQGWSPMTADQAVAYLGAQASHTCLVPGEWHQLGIAGVDDDLLIGDLGIWLSLDSTEAEFGISITPAAQGHGYSTECIGGLFELLFSTTPVAQIIASADARNAACLALLLRSGMRQTGIQQTEYKGEICTEHLFSLQRPASQPINAASK
jgi:ribosomal-protein-alanine N-acetyltransferase